MPDDDPHCRRCGVPLDGAVCSYLTPREAMQLLGTEWARVCWPDTWVALTFRKAHDLLMNVRVLAKAYDAGTGTSGKGSSIIDRCNLVLVTDVRFLNEAKKISEAGGRVWRICRPGAGLNGAAGAHVSETEMFSPEMDRYVDVDIVNDGTLEDLERKAIAALAAKDRHAGNNTDTASV
jgi:hypothetical protein